MADEVEGQRGPKGSEETMTTLQSRQRAWLAHGDVIGELSAAYGQQIATYPGPSPHAADAQVVDLVVGHHHLELEQDHSISSEDWAIGLVFSHMVCGGWPV